MGSLGPVSGEPFLGEELSWVYVKASGARRATFHCKHIFLIISIYALISHHFCKAIKTASFTCLFLPYLFHHSGQTSGTSLKCRACGGKMVWDDMSPWAHTDSNLASALTRLSCVNIAGGIFSFERC